jgi:ATP-binding cassette subfamily A (ABC1) protein 3
LKEADILCDKIAIINNGELKCYGSPKFLKDNFGQGYRLGILKSDSFSSSIFTNIIELFDFDFIIETDVASEMTLILPNITSFNLIELLKSIEENKNFIGIESFSIGSTTIEEVFLK